jgi:hypothetical protein
MDLTTLTVASEKRIAKACVRAQLFLNLLECLTKAMREASRVDVQKAPIVRDELHVTTVAGPPDGETDWLACVDDNLRVVAVDQPVPERVEKDVRDRLPGGWEAPGETLWPESPPP